MLLYPALTSLYPYFPPLLGVAYIGWKEALGRREWFTVAAWMLYAVIFESVWGLPLYGVWAVMVLVYALFDPKITYLFGSRSLINVINVVIFDLLYLLFLYFYASVVHEGVVTFDPIFLYYFVVDVAGVVLL